MLNIPAYPRRRWRFRLGIGTLVLSLGLLGGYGIPTIVRTVTVATAENAAENTREANRFWRMVAGDAPVDDSELGRVAATTRRLTEEPNPIRALLDYYVAPGELPDIEDRLGFHAFDRPAERGGTESDEGHFTDRFVLHAIQAAGVVPETSADDLMQPIPYVPERGWLRWEWGAAALASLLALAGLFDLWLRRDRRRWPVRAEKRAVADLSDEQRQVYQVIRSLEREPSGKQRNKLLNQAKALFTDMQCGLDTRDKLADLKKALAEAAETWEFKRAAYQELTGKPVTGRD